MNALARELPSTDTPDLSAIKLDFPRIASLQDSGVLAVRGDVAGWLCFRTTVDQSKGVLFVSRDHALHHQVGEYEARIKLMRIPFERYEVTIKDVNLLNQGAEGSDAGANEDAQARVVQMLREAARLKASDVHIQVRQEVTLIRVRVNGRIRTLAERTRAEGEAWVNSMYSTMAAEQEQVLNWKKDQKANLHKSFARQAGLAGARIATRPAFGNGLVIVLRLQYPETGAASIENIGFLPDKHLPLIRYMLANTHGIILVSGATGNGKSMTMKAMVERYCDRLSQACHFLTIEDPTEYEIRGEAVVQTPLIYNSEELNADKRAWPLAIKSAVRLDPDGIMPGELRDVNSAVAAIEAALTGHLVLSTLHVHNTTAILERLRLLGVTEDLLYNPSNFIGFINQSLIPALCPDCSVLLSTQMDAGGEPLAAAMDADVWHRLKRVMPDTGMVRVRGPQRHSCRTCAGSGEPSRRLTAEVCVPDAAFMEVYARSGMLAARKHWVVEGHGFTKVQHALRLVAEGILDPSSVEQIVGPLDQDLTTLGVLCAD